MRPLTIAIAGCGVAGLASALLLGRQGHDVTVFERFALASPLGSGLMIQPTGLAVLRVLGLAEQLVANGARIERLHGLSAAGRVVLDVRYGAQGFGTGVQRAALFDILYGALQARGQVFETGREVVSSRLLPDGRRRLIFAGGEASSAFDLVVDAMGSSTPLATDPAPCLAYGALWASLDWPAGAGFLDNALEQRYRRASQMVGVMPTGPAPPRGVPGATFFWSVRLDRLEALMRNGIAAWKAQVLELWPQTGPLLDQIDSLDAMAVARYRHRKLKTPVAQGQIHLGDAWRSSSPQLGQGANMALLDAYALSLALARHDNLGQALRGAIDLRRRHAWIYHALSAIFTPVYQSDGHILPFIRDRLIGPAAGAPLVSALQAAMVSGAIGAPLQRLGLVKGKAA